MATGWASVLALAIAMLVESWVAPYVDIRVKAAIALAVGGGVFYAARKWLAELLGE